MLKSQLRRQDYIDHSHWFAAPSRLYHLAGMLLKFYMLHSVHLHSSVQVPGTAQQSTALAGHTDSTCVMRLPCYSLPPSGLRCVGLRQSLLASRTILDSLIQSGHSLEGNVADMDFQLTAPHGPHCEELPATRFLPECPQQQTWSRMLLSASSH